MMENWAQIVRTADKQQPLILTNEFWKKGAAYLQVFTVVHFWNFISTPYAT